MSEHYYDKRKREHNIAQGYELCENCVGTGIKEPEPKRRDHNPETGDIEWEIGSERSDD